ncbi:MAG: 2-C-methyl-D-erythritol 2,4-cyclodiphosphate synthase [Clostridia bacterium]|nr:2-C-methyl-D-erythritol 2,4-cyclodiphosphate synthase [Clostridia bacterium]
MEKLTLILTCAGCGKRAGFNQNKLLEKINGTPVVKKAFDAFYNLGVFSEFIVTTSKTDFDEFNRILDGKATIVIGGKTRAESVKNALHVATGDIVLIHDGARPFVTKKIILDCIESVKKYGSGITAIDSVNTISKIDNDGFITETVGKNNVIEIQTPQGFYLNDIKRAYAFDENSDFPDESSVYLKHIGKPHYVIGDKCNIKLTYKNDFTTPSVGLCQNYEFRSGVGFDCHKLVNNRPLILGGVKIEHDKGLLGHSDADALLHAITDAILSACALRDIGYYFPDTDAKFKDANSADLLKTALDLVNKQGFKIKTVSAVIMAERPKLKPYIDLMKENIANILSITPNDVGISATTLEGLGFVGREEGICASATAVICKI